MRNIVASEDVLAVLWALLGGTLALAVMSTVAWGLLRFFLTLV
jgi:hypothetical protein